MSSRPAALAPPAASAQRLFRDGFVQQPRTQPGVVRIRNLGGWRLGVDAALRLRSRCDVVEPGVRDEVERFVVELGATLELGDPGADLCGE